MATKAFPPVLGFNNNVRYRGRVFHIQTEDSGVGSPRIVTHLFADGGRIIRTTRTEYRQHLERADLPQVVRQIMKDQHKAMFSALRTGTLDLFVEEACGPLPPATAADLDRPSFEPQPVANPPPREGSDTHVVTARPREKPASAPPAKRSEAPPARRRSTAPARKARSVPPPGPTRSRGKAANAPLADAAVISEKSLDELILSYLAEDLDGSSD